MTDTSRILARLEREFEQLYAIDECRVCGGRPCAWPTFCKACEVADRKKNPRHRAGGCSATDGGSVS
jgi:hypothetical protein